MPKSNLYVKRPTSSPLPFLATNGQGLAILDSVVTIKPKGFAEHQLMGEGK
jgi:hypothetical protein